MNSKVYSEINAIIENIDEDLKSKMPLKLLELINEKRNKYYEPEIDFRKPLYSQDLERNTIIFMTMIYYMCWCENQEEKQKILDILIANEK